MPCKNCIFRLSDGMTDKAETDSIKPPFPTSTKHQKPTASRQISKIRAFLPLSNPTSYRHGKPPIKRKIEPFYNGLMINLEMPSENSDNLQNLKVPNCKVTDPDFHSYINKPTTNKPLQKIIAVIFTV